MLTSALGCHIATSSPPPGSSPNPGHLGFTADTLIWSMICSRLEYVKRRCDPKTHHDFLCGAGPGSGASLVYVRACTTTGSLLQIRMAPSRKRHLSGGETPLIDGP